MAGRTVIDRTIARVPGGATVPRGLTHTRVYPFRNGRPFEIEQLVRRVIRETSSARVEWNLPEIPLRFSFPPKQNGFTYDEGEFHSANLSWIRLKNAIRPHTSSYITKHVSG